MHPPPHSDLVSDRKGYDSQLHPSKKNNKIHMVLQAPDDTTGFACPSSIS